MNKRIGFLAFLGERKNAGWLVLTVLALLTVVVITVLGAEGGDATDSLSLEVEGLCSSVEGVGECRVMLSFGDGGEVLAVAVICEGGDSVGVRYRLTELLSSLYGISTHRICIEKLE